MSGNRHMISYQDLSDTRLRQLKFIDHIRNIILARAHLQSRLNV